MKQPEDFIFGNEDDWEIRSSSGMGNVVTEEKARKDTLLFLPNGLPYLHPRFLSR